MKSAWHAGTSSSTILYVPSCIPVPVEHSSWLFLKNLLCLLDDDLFHVRWSLRQNPLHVFVYLSKCGTCLPGRAAQHETTQAFLTADSSGDLISSQLSAAAKFGNRPLLSELATALPLKGRYLRSTTAGFALWLLGTADSNLAHGERRYGTSTTYTSSATQAKPTPVLLFQHTGITYSREPFGKMLLCASYDLPNCDDSRSHQQQANFSCCTNPCNSKAHTETQLFHARHGR